MARYPSDSLIETLLLAMTAKRAEMEGEALAEGGVYLVWGFGCVDERTAERQELACFTSAQVADGGSVLKYAFGLQNRIPGIWGYGFAYLGWMGSLTPGMPMSVEARTAFAHGRIDDAWIPELAFAAVIYDARGGMHSTCFPLLNSGDKPIIHHADTRPRADAFIQAFHDGAIDADTWLCAHALDINLNEQIIRRALPEIATMTGR